MHTIKYSLSLCYIYFIIIILILMHLILCILILAHSILSTLILMDGIKKAKLVCCFGGNYCSLCTPGKITLGRTTKMLRIGGSLSLSRGFSKTIYMCSFIVHSKESKLKLIKFVKMGHNHILTYSED